MAEGEPTMTLYHYTSEASKDQILKDGVIKQSGEGATFEKGTYLTKVPPTQGKEQVARNNYDGKDGTYWAEREKQGSVDYAIKVKVPAEEVRKLRGDDPGVNGRSICKVEGDLSLKTHEYEVEKVPDKPRHN